MSFDRRIYNELTMKGHLRDLAYETTIGPIS